MRFYTVVALGGMLTGCAAAGSPPVMAPTAEAPAVAGRMVQRSWPATPRHAAFSWTLDEAGERFRGRGVVRFQAPNRLRLDLFGPRGETYLAAALVGDSIRLPPNAQGQIALPSPALLWGALGILRPPTGSRPVAVAGEGEDTTVRYSGGSGETWDFRTGRVPLARVQRIARGGVAESVEVTWDAPDRIRSSRYRDWSALRTLDLEFETVTNADPFPPSIWLPQIASR